MAAFRPGTLLGGRYRIVGRLGRGGMGEVYRADDLKLAQPVALKFLPAEVDHDPARLMQLHSEVRMARQVSHPNVCRVYDIDEVDGHTFLSMEYVDGEELGSLLRRIGRFPVERALEMARQICGGPGRGPRAGRHPSRSQAGQRDARRRRQGADHRLRAGRRDRRDRPRRNPGIHGARTARRQRGDGAKRHLRARAGALRALHGTARHRGEERRRTGAQARGRDPAAVADRARPGPGHRSRNPPLPRTRSCRASLVRAGRGRGAAGRRSAGGGACRRGNAVARNGRGSRFDERAEAAHRVDRSRRHPRLPGGVRRDVGSSPADWQRSARKASRSSRRSSTGGCAHARLCRRAGGLGVRVRFVWGLSALRQAAAGRGRDAGAAPKRQAPGAPLLVSQQPAAADPGNGQRPASRSTTRRSTSPTCGRSCSTRPAASSSSRRCRHSSTSRRRGPGDHRVAGHSSTRRPGHHEAQARHAPVDAAHVCGRTGRVGRPDARLAGAADPRRGRSVPRPPRLSEDGEPVDAARAHARSAADSHRAHRPAVHCHRGADRARRRGAGGAPQPAQGPRGPARSGADLGGHLRGDFRRLAAERETRDRRRRRARTPLRRARMVALLRRRGVAALPGARAVCPEVLADDADLLEPPGRRQCPRSTGRPRCADRRVALRRSRCSSAAWRRSFARCSVIRWSQTIVPNLDTLLGHPA